MNNFVLSIDWDHTLRNSNALDLGLLSLIFYAKAKEIPVGLTTHRDCHNTTYYMVSEWQDNLAETAESTFPAAISYWQKSFLDGLNLKLDFISARFQPEYHPNSYYEQVILPYEEYLMREMASPLIKQNPQDISVTIKKYLPNVEEVISDDNHFKQAQTRWLTERYPGKTILHIDDDFQVFKNLPGHFEVNQVHTFLFESPAIVKSSAEELNLYELLGIKADAEIFSQENNFQLLEKDDQKWLAVCLWLLTADKIDFYLKHLNSINDPLFQLLASITHQVLHDEQPIKYLAV